MTFMIASKNCPGDITIYEPFIISDDGHSVSILKFKWIHFYSFPKTWTYIEYVE